MNLDNGENIILYILDQFNDENIEYSKDEVVDCLFLFEYYDTDREHIEPFRETDEFDYYLYRGRPYSLDVIQTIEELESSNWITYTEKHTKYTINKNTSNLQDDISDESLQKLNYIIPLFINSYISDFDIVEYSLQVDEEDLVSGTLIDQLIIHSKTPEINSTTIVSKVI